MKTLIMLVISFCIFSSFLYANIIYTDVDPDITLAGSLDNPWDQFNIDLDKDGIADFTLTHFYPSDELHYTELQVINFRVGDILVDQSDNPLALDYGVPINSGQNKWLEFMSFAIHIRENWKGAVDKFLGIRIMKGDGWIYGWIRLDIPQDESNCILKDYAYESELNKGLKAGEKNSTSASETLMNSEMLTISPNPASDYIEIRQPSEGLKPSEGSEIKIYNAFGECVMIESIHPMSQRHRMNISHLPAGLYFIKIGNSTEKFMVVR